ncbi:MULTISPECIES: DUF5313 family protein [Protofrankia]|uniref:DUF5313 domain-containing protein n=1 Tax=Protofrankia coriariae TaxID=1562887 RepID=A0ABR5F5R7_9ACTN|nr:MULTISPECIES: DUF5313 family protein [Protofrankia]KLL12081.1 hypothetical protein FrCorBMG51_07500 [Protofrankia coriariae]ONH35375.1 hypothetical protein BL254_11970 [Protofrankia sp. BMG5.30]
MGTDGADDSGTDRGGAYPPSARSSTRPGGAAPASGSVPAEPASAERPPLTGRIYYLVGGTLPPRYNQWISHDLTGPRWRVRQASRPPLLMLPFAVMFALLPGRLNVRLTIAIVLLAIAVGLGFATAGYFRNRRLVQHGFPPVFPPEEDENTSPEDAGHAAADHTAADHTNIDHNRAGTGRDRPGAEDH